MAWKVLKDIPGVPAGTVSMGDKIENELAVVSGGYMKDYPDWFKKLPDPPEPDQIKLQSDVNKQGRSDEEAPPELKTEFLSHLDESHRDAFENYRQFVDAGLARELARINLPLSTYTEWYWKIDLHNLLHFLRLRLDAHAQYEIRQYARVIADIVKTTCPITWEAFQDYAVNALDFSAVELRILRDSLASFSPGQQSLIDAGLSRLEAGEFLDKLERIKEM